MEKQTGTYSVLKFNHWSPTFEYDAAAFIFHRIARLVCQRDFRLTCTPGTDRILVLYNISGRGIVHYCNTVLSLEPNSALIMDISPGYSVEALTDNWEYVWLQLSGNMINHILNDFRKDKSILFFTSPQIAESFDRIFELTSFAVTKERDIQLSVLIYDLLGKLILCQEVQHKTDNALFYIQKNYMHDISTHELAEKCHMSKYHFIRCFKIDHGISPIAYINQCRILAAKKLLLDTNKSISHIAAETGYSSSSYFCNQFKAHTGFSPKDYRNGFHKR